MSKHGDFREKNRRNIWHVTCSAARMRLLCHLLCLGLNLAYGTCVAAAPVKSQSVTSVSLASIQHAPVGQTLAHSLSLMPAPSATTPLSYISVGKPVTKPWEIDAGLHRIRFVDRYWPAKVGYEPPVRVSNLCLNGLGAKAAFSIS